MTDLTDLSLAQARDGLRRREFSATELAEAHLYAMEKARALNAYVLETPDAARAMASKADARLKRGDAQPLEGVAIGVKDMFATANIRTTACSNIIDNFVPSYESTVCANLWRDGAVLLGKLNNDEFAMGSSNETSCFGPAVSPWRRTRTRARPSSALEAGASQVDPAGAGDANTLLVPGGSSGGSAAAVAAHLCLGATGTDTGGSIRQPAAFTGSGGATGEHVRADLRALLALGNYRIRFFTRSGRTHRAHGARCRDIAAFHGRA